MNDQNRYIGCKTVKDLNRAFYSDVINLTKSKCKYADLEKMYSMQYARLFMQDMTGGKRRNEGD